MFSSMFLCSCCHKRCILVSFFWQCTIPYLQIPHIIHHHPTSMYANLKPAMTAMCSSSTCLFRAQESANEPKLFWTSLIFCIRRFNFVRGVPVEVPIFGWGWQIFSSNIELPKVDSFFHVDVDLFSSGAQAKGVPFFSSQYATIGRGSTSTCGLKRTLCVFFLGLWGFAWDCGDKHCPRKFSGPFWPFWFQNQSRVLFLFFILHLPSLHSTCKGLLKMTNQLRKQMSDVMGCHRMSKESALKDGTPQAGLAATIKSRVTQWRDALTLERHIAWFFPGAGNGKHGMCILLTFWKSTGQYTVQIRDGTILSHHFINPLALSLRKPTWEPATLIPKAWKSKRLRDFAGLPAHLNIRLLWLLLEAKSKPRLQRPTHKLKQTLSVCSLAAKAFNSKMIHMKLYIEASGSLRNPPDLDGKLDNSLDNSEGHPVLHGAPLRSWGRGSCTVFFWRWRGVVNSNESGNCCTGTGWCQAAKTKVGDPTSLLLGLITLRNCTQETTMEPLPLAQSFFVHASFTY